MPESKYFDLCQRLAARAGESKDGSVPEDTDLIDAVQAIIDLEQNVTIMRDHLLMAAKRFRQYEEMHRSKETKDGDFKASINAEIAERLEVVIQGL